MTQPTSPRELCEATIKALRAQMPPDFRWNFGDLHRPTECGTVGCALGLAMQLNFITGQQCMVDDNEAWGMSYGEYNATFYRSQTYGFFSMHKVTPAMVADRLEALLASGDAGQESVQCQDEDADADE